MILSASAGISQNHSIIIFSRQLRHFLLNDEIWAAPFKFDFFWDDRGAA